MYVVIHDRIPGWRWTLKLVSEGTMEEISDVRMPITAHIIVRAWFDQLNAVLDQRSLESWERLCDTAQGQQRTPINRAAPLRPVRRALARQP